jgi:putative nucleotidyltransferase with HDIG domain
MKSRVLFVDDEKRVLQGLQRMLRPLREDWDMTFAESGEEALRLLDTGPFDVVVSDMRMPGMSGVELLEEVKRRQPEAVRFILSGQSSEESVLSSVGPTHQFLAKPCGPDVLIATVRRACALRGLLRNHELQQLLSQVGALPCVPDLYLRLVAELRAPNASVHRIADIVSEDVGMSAKILQLVNSAFFGIRRHVSEPRQAISLLGLSTVTALVLSVKVFGQFEAAHSRSPKLSGLAAHSLAVAGWAREIARAERASVQTQDEAFTAALLHDVGKLVLATQLAERYDEATRLAASRHCQDWVGEREVFGADHAHVGAYLLGLWGLPDPIVEALAYHHEPERSAHDAFAPLTAVHAANALQHQQHPNPEPGEVQPLSMDYLKSVGCADSAQGWLALDPAAAPSAGS